MADQTTRMAGSLHGGIVMTSAACALVPVVLVLVWTTWGPKGQGTDGSDPNAGQALASIRAIADTIDRWMVNNEAILRTWGQTPAIVEGVRGAAVEHHDRGFIDRIPEELNAEFVHRRHLGTTPQADEYIKAQVERSAAWSEVHYSDEYGFTVGGTGGEEDFVQTDEPWWLAAWAKGSHRGRVVFDDNLGGYGLRVALRMDDPATEAAIGVIDAVLAIEALQDLVDQLAIDSGYGIRVVSDWGELLAETASGHARDRIVRPRQRSARSGVGGTRGSEAAGGRGSVVGDGVERGWVRLSGSRGPHRDWIVVAERESHGGAGLVRQALVAVVALVVATCVGIAGGLLVRRRIVARLQRLGSGVDRLSQADTSVQFDVAADDAIGQFAQRLENLRRLMERAMQARGKRRRE